MRKLILLTTMVMITGCTKEFNWTGLTELEEFSNDLANSTQVADVVCSRVTFSVSAPVSAQCYALNAQGTLLSYYGQSLVKWSSTDFNVVKITLDGIISPNGGIGTAYIKATGTFDTVDSVLVTVGS